MKKLSFLIFLIPALCLGLSYESKVANHYNWSYTATSSNDVTWQLYNVSTTTDTIYVDGIDIATDRGGYFIVYSTPVGTGFTGAKVSGTALPGVVEGGNVSISSVTYCLDASVLTGNIEWQGVLGASETITIDRFLAITPGNAIYVWKGNNGASEESSASFHFIEAPR